MGKTDVGEMQQIYKNETQIPSASSKYVPRTSVLQMHVVEQQQLSYRSLASTQHKADPLGESVDDKTLLSRVMCRTVTQLRTLL